MGTEAVIVAVISGLLGPILLFTVKAGVEGRRERRTVDLQEKSYSLDERGRSVEEFRAIVDGLKQSLVQVERDNDGLRNRVTQVEEENARLRVHIDLMETRQLAVLATNYELAQHNRALEAQIAELLRQHYEREDKDAR